MRHLQAIVIGLLLASMSAQAKAELIAGMGQASFDWCGGDGCWHQPPLSYQDDRRVPVYIFGFRDKLTSNLKYDVLYHQFGTAKVSGYYVHDVDYDPVHKQVLHQGHFTGPWPMNAYMTTETNGISLSLLPTLTFKSGLELFGRVGIFFYRQDTHFSYSTDKAHYRDSGSDHSPVIGMGVSYPVGHFSLGTEVMAFNEVKFGESPVGGGPESPRDFGLVEYVITIGYRF